MSDVKNLIKAKKPWEVEGVEWKEVRLGEIAKEIKSGGTPSRKNKEYWENGTIPWVKIKDIPEEGYVNDTEEKITEKGLNNSSAKLLPKGTILFTIFATIGHVGILNIEATTNQAIAGIIPKKEYDNKYLYWVLLKFGQELKERGRGGAQNNVNLTFLKNLKIPIPFRNGKPDLETQKKIVEYIETNFEKIDRILEKKKKELEFLDELWESVLEHAFKPKEGEEWREVRFLDKIDLLKGKKPKEVLKQKQKNALPYLTLDYFREKKIKEYIPIEENKILRVQKGDLVIIADGSRSGELFFCDIEGVLVSTMAKLEIKEHDLSKKYVFWFLNTYFEHLNKSKYTATPHVNKNFLKNLKIPLPFHNNQPDLEKQKEIAQYLDNVYQKIKTLKEKIQNQIIQLEELKESILDEVFRHDKAR
ncbi:restriction endonuclease subunit S [Methanofervidicoccus abyssi]|uniref:Type I restriction enzyme, S subunit n=1 Tax=Methanofervidicoccus abyssi TaxID=2082189 RepID=A0A401HQK5_9EURY|nr:restriction endonuclease subunit S [Methanofervidicoccus abyssi]GBF36554.1 type I restriction enzyme, S subunit [Methanofervidicoccus abyssi]